MTEPTKTTETTTATQGPATASLALDPERLRDAIKDRYAAAARRADAAPASCCGASPDIESMVSKDLYAATEVDTLPESAVRASLGCGNPTALADLGPGEVVLDLGSGGGIDVLLSARRVGPAGKAYGLDMTPEMLELARRNQADAGVANAEFLEGEMENIPLPDASVDVIVSNCVINLSADKNLVLAEALRVLRPGGRFAVSDIVTLRPVPPQIGSAMELWSACITGALDIDDYRGRLASLGFADVDIEVTRTYGPEDVSEDAAQIMGQLGLDPADVRDLYASAFVRARKPL